MCKARHRVEITRVTSFLRQASVEELVSPRSRIHIVIKTVFQNVPASNVLSETRFARMTKSNVLGP